MDNQNNEKLNQEQILITIFYQLQALVRLKKWDMETRFITGMDIEIEKETDEDKKKVLLDAKAYRLESYKKNLEQIAYPHTKK